MHNYITHQHYNDICLIKIICKWDLICVSCWFACCQKIQYLLYLASIVCSGVGLCQNWQSWGTNSIKSQYQPGTFVNTPTKNPCAIRALNHRHAITRDGDVILLWLVDFSLDLVLSLSYLRCGALGCRILSAYPYLSYWYRQICQTICRARRYLNKSTFDGWCMY